MLGEHSLPSLPLPALPGDWVIWDEGSSCQSWFTGEVSPGPLQEPPFPDWVIDLTVTGPFVLYSFQHLHELVKGPLGGSNESKQTTSRQKKNLSKTWKKKTKNQKTKQTRISCRLGWSQTHHVATDEVELHPPISSSQLLVLQVCPPPSLYP